MKKKIRFLSEYAFHYLKKYLLTIILGSVFGSILFLQKDNLNYFYQALQTQRTDIGIEGLYTTQTLPSEITKLLSFGFTSITENDKADISPIIENITIRENNLNYTFTFKKGLTWHNGKKFDTSDLKLNISNINLKPLDSEIIEIRLSEAFSPLLSKLNKPIFLNKTLIGLGDHKVDNITYQDGYIKTLTIVPIVKSRQKTIYHFYPNNDDLLNAFKLGEVDKIIASHLDNNLAQWPKVKISQQISTDKYLAIFLNTNRLQSKQLRQALSYATPKSDDKNNRCLGPISPNSWAYNSQIKEYIYNPERAKELYQKNEISKIDLLILDRKLLSFAENIKKTWEKIFNIKVNIKIESNQSPQINQYEATLAYGSIPNDPDQYSFWHSTQNKTNITNFNNSRIDKLLEEGRQIQNIIERKDIYIDFQRFLLEESPAIFINFPTTYTIFRVK